MLKSQLVGAPHLAWGVTCRCEARKRCHDRSGGRGELAGAGSDCPSLPEEQLDCHISIIKEINEAEVVSPFMLMTAQIFVQQAMEKRW